MRLLIHEIEKLKALYCDRKYEKQYQDDRLNLYHHNCRFLTDYQEKLTEYPGITEEVVLYSLYYWGRLLIDRAYAVSGRDVGLEQWHFRIIEQIEYCCGAVDWKLLEQIDRNEIHQEN